MSTLALNDTIVAISTGPSAAPVGGVRMSGPDAFGWLKSLTGEDVAARSAPGAFDAFVHYAELTLPARVLWFRTPRSYTGQDVVEIHTPGCPPLLRLLVDELIRRGGRAALPGEFTARAFVNHKLTADQINGVLGLIQAQSESSARSAARQVRGETARHLDHAREKLLDLLARIEAGIDFVEEEDVRFVTAAQARDEIRGILDSLNRGRERTPSNLPHVVIAGLANAGKSSLFNALLGAPRTIVSPEEHTTRDVIGQEAELGGVRVLLHDTAGFGESSDALAATAQDAAHAAGLRADLVLWVHDGAREWSPAERASFQRLAESKRLLVLSKSDLRIERDQCVAGNDPPAIAVSAISGEGLDRLRAAVAQELQDWRANWGSASAPAATAALIRAQNLLSPAAREILDPEIVAWELRHAVFVLAGQPSNEEVLGRIFGLFCVGK
ncbi:MAG: 50S ribosome-binding GTPase [Planctomycetes bacterium]|nr:50S ribosome-binding GTPase [Planctomycetota bacterium]